MTFPTGTQIPTTNVASDASDPSLARQDFFDLITAFNAIIASYNQSQGVLVLDGSGLVPSSKLPAYYATVGGVFLQPATKVVSISNVLRLSQTFTNDLGSVGTGTDSPVAGDICYLVDGDAGQPCLSVYDGTKWRIVRLATQVGDVGASITATSTLTATADV